MSLLFSVVTPCYNSRQFIEGTVQSVLSQAYPHIEYMVFDGASTDGTVELLRSYESRLTLISEPDKGQTDAINKGWRRAKGDILTWLNADDRYFPDTIQIAANYFLDHPEADWIYGKPYPVDAEGRLFPFRHIPEAWDYQRLLAVNFITQPSVFIRRHVYEAMGELNQELDYNMDYEYWLRIGQRYPAHFVPQIKVYITYTRETKTFTGGIPRLNELEAVIRKYGGSDLPLNRHYEWVIASFEAALAALLHAKWKAAWGNIKAIFRYPRAIPYGFVKWCIASFVPNRLETKLRQLFLKGVIE